MYATKISNDSFISYSVNVAKYNQLSSIVKLQNKFFVRNVESTVSKLYVTEKSQFNIGDSMMCDM